MYKVAIKTPYNPLFRQNTKETFMNNKLVIHDSMHNATNDMKGISMWR